ncbi:flavin reductase family protein [Actinomadura sp. 3N508]|uniref:flavin reductase family protein n=1 Tax=Actinomadura sp. 3N508 TaxID=3375153 RepID=UPI0037ABC8B4
MVVQLQAHTGKVDHLLDAGPALECELVATHHVDDHTIFIGAVHGASSGSGDDGLLFFRSQYTRTGNATP